MVAFLLPVTAQNTIPSGFEAWVMPIEKRVFAGSFTRRTGPEVIQATGLRNEFVSIQLACRHVENSELSCALTDLRGDQDSIGSDRIRVRFGAYLPVDETSTLTADPLLETEMYPILANVAVPVWITIHIPKELPADLYRGDLTLRAGAEIQKIPIELEVLNGTLPDPQDYSFYLNIWQHPNGVARAHKVELWSERHWDLLSKYAENMAQHGQKSILTSIIHDPWNSQCGYEFPSMVEWRFPGQWTLAETSRFEWDFEIFDRYVDLMMQAGIRSKIEMYAMVKGPGPTPDTSIRYLDTQEGVYRTQKLKAGDAMWFGAWKAFFPALKKHLQEKGWWQIAYLGFDEKPEQVMEAMFDLINEAGPDYRLVLSGGHAAERENVELVLYFAALENRKRWAEEIAPMVKAVQTRGQMVSFYTACEPRYPNTFIYSSLRESRMIAWIARKYGLDGYLRFIFNAFPEDVWTQPAFKWHSGDMFLVYPGTDGPLDSMRWELLRQGIQDYEAWRIAYEMADFWGLSYHLKQLEASVDKATILDSCRDIPLVEDARKLVNDVIREVGSPDEMGKKMR